jgi:adenosylmethionine-8-amino-7-oxononanoate aminotransferase
LKDLVEPQPTFGVVRKIGLSGITELDEDKETKEVMGTWNGSCQEITALRKSFLEHELYVCI